MKSVKQTKGFQFCFLPLLLLFAGAGATAQPCMDTQEKPLLAVLVDTSRTLTITDITAGVNLRQFSTPVRTTPNFGYTQSAVWVQVVLGGCDNALDGRVLIVENSLLEQVELYMVDSAGTITKRTAGRGCVNEGALAYRFPAFKIEGEKHGSVAWIRMTTSDVMSVPVSVVSHEAYMRRVRNEYFVFGLYYGGMILIACICGMAFVSLRDNAYVWYTLFVIMYGFFQMTVNGLDIEFLRPDVAWRPGRVVGLFCSAAVLFGTLFSWSILQLRRRSRAIRLTVVGFAIIAAGVVVMAVTIGPVRILGPLGSALALLFVAGMLPLGVVSYKNGNSAARYYLAGAAVLFAGILSNALKNFGLLPPSLFTEYGNQIGSAVSVVLLSAALADRMAILRRERLETAMRAMTQEKRAIEQERRSAEFKYQALQAKINPHFLFNTLNTITGLITQDSAKAQLVVERLSKLFRFTLTASQRQFVTLAEELDVVRSYLTIEQIRFGERLSFTIDCPPGAGYVAVPGLILQPLVENSIKHGLSPKIDGGNIRIDVSVENSLCRIAVVDTGIGFGAGADGGTGHGLTSVRERMTFAFGSDFHMDIKNEAGVRIEMLFPAREKLCTGDA